MYSFLDSVRTYVRVPIYQLARLINKLSGGKMTPNGITLIGLLGHLPVAWLIASGQLLLGAAFLVIFGLMDTLDGQLAKLQGSASKKGMFLDSVTDRFKEVMLYIAIAFYFVAHGQPYFAVWAAAACGIAVIVSYLNAWGEVATAGIAKPSHQQNKSFRSGLLGYDLRIFLVIVGLALNQLPILVVVIALLSLLTALQRLDNVLKRF